MWLTLFAKAFFKRLVRGQLKSINIDSGRTNRMNYNSSSRQVDLEQLPQLGKPEVGGAVGVVDGH